MINQLVAVKDRKARVFFPPWTVPNEAIAQRLFTQEVNREAHDNAMYSHPEDFELHRLGTYDTDTGVIVYGPPTFICSGDECKVNTSKQP